MASTSAALSTASFTTAVVGTRSNVSHRRSNVIKITGLNAYQGLKVHSCVASLGVPMTAEESFVNLVKSIKPKSNGKGGGPYSAMGNAANEIFNIVLIMSGLTLVGVAVGFALLRIEAFVEEAEEA